MKSNKQKWAERHEKGETKIDVAMQAQISADAAKVANVVTKAQAKQRKVRVDAVAEAVIDSAVRAEKKNIADQQNRDTQAKDITDKAAKEAAAVKKGDTPEVVQ